MVIDIIFIIVAVWGFYLGFSRGIIKTVFTVLSFLFGLIAAFKFAPATTQFLETTFNNNNPLMFAAGFLLSFVLTMLIIRMAARFLEGILESANINVINQFLGGVLLSGIMILLYSVLLWFGKEAHIINQETKGQSYTYEYLETIPGRAQEFITWGKPIFLEFWDRSVDVMDRLQEMSEQTESEAEIFDIEEDNEKDSSSR